MALVRAYTIQCDRCHGEGGFAATAQEARTNARRARWKRIPKSGRDGDQGRDLCPRCAKDSTEAGPRGCTGICDREPEGEHARNCPNREA